MSVFQCKTCDLPGTAEPMMKHLMTTRHKTIIDTTHDEEVCCEECQDNNNIHQLQIVRFGGDDISIYCTSCFQKLYSNTNDRPSTCYTLQNGAILSYWGKYLSVRDCVCQRCGDGAHLNIDTNSKKVLCDKCIKVTFSPEQIADKNKFKYISESTGKFLYYLLNIPEPSNKNQKVIRRKGGRNQKRRGGKKSGKKGKPGRRTGSTNTTSTASSKVKAKKPMTLMEKITNDAFSNRRENSKITSASTTSLSSFKGFKAVNSSTELSIRSNISESSIKTDINNQSKKSSKTKKKEDNKSSKKEKSPATITAKVNKNRGSNKEKKKSNENISNTTNNSNKKDGSPTSSPSTSKNSSTKKKEKFTFKDPLSPLELNDNRLIHKLNGIKNKAQSNEWGNGDSWDDSSNTVSTNSNSASKSSSMELNKKASKNKTENKQKDTRAKSNINNSNNDSKNETSTNLTKNKKVDKNTKNTSTNKSTTKNKNNKNSNNKKTTTFSKNNDVKKESSNEPELSPWNDPWSSGWDTPDISSKPSMASINDSTKTTSNEITAGNAKKKNNKKNRRGNTETDIEEGTHISMFKKFKPKLTFPDLQAYLNNFCFALFFEQKLENTFIYDFEISWPRDPKEIVFILQTSKSNPELETMLPPNLRNMGRSPFNEKQPLVLSTQDESQIWYVFVKELSQKRGNYILLLESFPWNASKLPTNYGNNDLKILPLSVQTNRIVFAMTRLTNPKFIDLLLGTKKIKQFYFNNRLKFTSDKLNDSQKEAVEHVLNNSVTVIQGPPGTGKTSTIEEIILQYIENFHSFPILCVAASNIAIDNIAEKLMVSKPNIKILRILSDRKEKEYDEDHPLGSICLHNKIFNDLSPEMKTLLDQKRSGDISKNGDKKIFMEITRLTTKYVSQAQILLTTNITAGGRQLKVIKELPLVIMDESTQSSEVSTLVPLSLPGIKNFVFVGDEKQLSSFSNIPELELSLFERILSNGSYENPKMLNTQYRMHPQISEFPIKKIYGGKLFNGVTEADKSWPGIKYPLFFYRCNKGSETKVMNSNKSEGNLRGYTFINENEYENIIEILYKLIDEKNVKLEDIGIVTPYSAQRDYICGKLLKDMVINPSQVDMIQETDENEFMNSNYVGHEVQSHVVNIINGLQVATIDSFQGHEKNFIIFSCVRNNSENNIGFLRDKRRLNVALTRSKNGLILVGNDSVLERGDQLWSDYIKYLRENNLIFPSLAEY